MWPKIVVPALLLVSALPATGSDPQILRIGILASMAEDKPPRYREIGPPELNKLVKEFTGLRSVTFQGLDAFSAAKQLDAKKWDLGVFTGIEFAWVQKQYPHLKPLMVAITQENALQAALVVRKGSASKGFGDLKGKDIAILETRLACRLFADKNCNPPRNTFAKFFQAPNGQDALADVLRGKVKAAIVDTPTLKHFQDLYPGRFKNLTILKRSPAFPPPVIVGREGLPTELLQQFRNGMLKVSRTEKGRMALMDFGILRFQEVPKDFQETLTDFATRFPPPQ